MTKEKYLELFKNYCHIKQLSKNWMDNIPKFLDFCEQKNIDILNIKYQDLSAYVASLMTEGYKNTSINLKISTVRCFYRCLLDYKICKDEVVTPELMKIHILRLDRTLQTYITEEELNRMISMSMSFISRIKPEKIKAVLLFLFYTGLRKGEFENLKREDLDIEKCVAKIKIPTKNKNERLVFFPKRVAQAIAEYYNLEEEKFNAFNMTSRKLVFFLKKAREFLPKEKRYKFHPHTLRHSYAKMLASKNIDVRVAQKLLGHKYLKNTLIYYDPDIDIAQKVYMDNIT